MFTLRLLADCGFSWRLVAGMLSVLRETFVWLFYLLLMLATWVIEKLVNYRFLILNFIVESFNSPESLNGFTTS